MAYSVYNLAFKFEQRWGEIVIGKGEQGKYIDEEKASLLKIMLERKAYETI